MVKDETKDENNEGRKVHDANDGLPIDTGWAWVVLAASWTNLFLVNGAFRTFGIMFADIQQKYDASASQISIIAALNSVGFGLSTMLVQTIGLKFFSTRQTVMAGSFGMGISYVISAFSPFVELNMVFQGFGTGMTTGLMFAPTSCLIGQYFEKRRGLAMCITSTGGGVGTIVYSFLLRILLDSFGLSGTLLLMGGICFNGLVSGALQRPLEFFRTRDNNKMKPPIDEEEVNKPMLIGNKDKLNVETLLQIKDVDKCVKAHEMQLSPLLLRSSAAKRIRTYSEKSNISAFHKLSSSVHKGEFWRFASNELSASIANLQINSNEHIPVETRNGNVQDFKSVETIHGFFKGMCSLHIMKKPVFILFTFIAIVLTPAFSMVSMFLPVHAKDIGFTDGQASFLITMNSIVDVLTIPLWGAISDKHWLRSIYLAAIAATALWVATFFLPFYTSFPWLLFYTCVFGLFGRVWFSMSTLIIVDLLGLENLQGALGVQLLCQTLANSVVMIAIGNMRDAFGSYLPCYLSLAIMMVTGTIGLLLLPIVEKCDKKRNRSTQEIIVA